MDAAAVTVTGLTEACPVETGAEYPEFSVATQFPEAFNVQVEAREVPVFVQVSRIKPR